MRKREAAVDVRYVSRADGSRELDEIVARECSVHLEKMSEHEFYLGITTANGVCVVSDRLEAGASVRD
jgi:hypothetical protein